MKITRWTSLAAALVLAIQPPSAPAQDPATPPSAAPNGAPGTPGRDRMEQFRQRMNDFLKTSLKATDEEWAVIEPLLEKVEAKQREAMNGRFSALGGRRGGHPGGDQPGADRPEQRPTPPSSPETEALKAVLASDSTPADDIKAKLEALRTAHKKAAADLDLAREDLRKVLTLRQEATLVMVGILE